MISAKPLTTPILLLIYKRSEELAKLLEVLAVVQPTNLYVAGDGPKNDIDSDCDQVEQARALIETINWPCSITTLYRTENLGCRSAVSEAISWFFRQEQEGIILEEDCIPSISFFDYCTELLARFRDDDRVFAISGDNFQPEDFVCQHSYYFSKYPHCWGWATWRRAWSCWDDSMMTWPTARDNGILRGLNDGCSEFESYWSDRFDAVYDRRIDSWAYPWTYLCWAQNGLTVLPARNLVTNIGFGDQATRTKKGGPNIGKKSEEIDWPLTHPTTIFRRTDADSYTDRNHFKIVKKERKKWWQS